MSVITKKVLVYGCFDRLNSTDIKFLEEAAKLGDVYVCVENDQNQCRTAVFNAAQRLYMIESIKYVYNARLIPNFERAIDDIIPDIFYSKNSDQHKKSIVTKKNIEYIVSSNETDDEKQEQRVAQNEDRDKHIEKLKFENSKLRQLCKALQSLNDSLKETNNIMRKQIIKIQKDCINSFAVIALLQEKLEQKQQYDEDEPQEPQEPCCSLCFGMMESDDLITIQECQHKFHSMCIYQSIQTDVGIYQKMPICSICDVDGKQILISNAVAIDVIQRQDADFIAQYKAIVTSNTKQNS